MKSGISATPRQLLVGIILLALLGLYMYVTSVFQPLLRSANDLGATVHRASVQLQQVQQLVTQEGTLRQEYAGLTSNVTALRTALPMDTELPSMLQLLSDLAGESGVKIISIFPHRALDSSGTTQKPSKTGAGPVQLELYKEIPIEIEALTGFHQLGMFLSRVESAAQPMRIHKLEITADQKELKRQSVNLVLIAYFAFTKNAAPNTAKVAGS